MGSGTSNCVAPTIVWTSGRQRWLSVIASGLELGIYGLINGWYTTQIQSLNATCDLWPCIMEFFMWRILMNIFHSCCSAIMHCPSDIILTNDGNIVPNYFLIIVGTSRACLSQHRHWLSNWQWKRKNISYWHRYCATQLKGTGMLQVREKVCTIPRDDSHQKYTLPFKIAKKLG